MFLNKHIHCFSTVIICAALVSLSSCKEDKTSSTQVNAVQVTFKKEGNLTIKKAITDSILQQIDIEIADDDYQRETGLMYRKSLGEKQGMLFVFPIAKFQSFYMKNTQIALDILYIDENYKIVSIQKNAKPMDESSLPSAAPAKYVLEINAGLSDSWNIEVGDYISYK